MAKQLSVDEQNLRRKARRRLIGAFALTLAVVVILPMVLDSEPRPAGKDIDIRIPALDEVGEFVPKIADLDLNAALPSPAHKAESSPASAGNSEIEAAGKVLRSSNVKAKAKGENKPAVDADSYVAQVGAYSNADTAIQELNKLKKWGYKAYTEKVSGMVRVRIGPYADREKAEKVRQQLEKHGLHPVVMNAKGS